MGQISTVKRQESWSFLALVLHCSLWQWPNVSFRLSFLHWKFDSSQLNLIPSFCVSVLHWHSTTVPLETKSNFFIFKQLWHVYKLSGTAVNVILFLAILWTIFLFVAFIQDQAARDKALQTMASMSSAQIVSASVLHNKALAAQGMPPATYNNESQGYQVREIQWSCKHTL